MKLRAVFLSALMVFSIVGGGVAFGSGVAQAAANEPADLTASDLSGEGTSDDPYQISNASELQAMEDNLGAHYTLVSNVDASDTSEWNGGDGFAPIGDSGTPFTGTFDGNGYTISNLTINRSGSLDPVGLFGYVGSSGAITQTGLEDANVTGDAKVGGLVGLNYGAVNGSYATGNVSGDNRVGGLVGGSAGTILESNATANVSGNIEVGGLVGVQVGGSIRASNASGSAIGSESVGGLVGLNEGEGTIEHSTASGTVILNWKKYSHDYLGGLVGKNDQGIITNSNATGDVQAGNVTSVGGLVGYTSGADAVINVSYATGNVTGNDDVGGFVGTTIDSTVNQTYATGTVDGASNVGGLVGNATGSNTEVANSYAAGTVSATGTPVGGLVGVNDGGTVIDAYWDTETTGVSSSGPGTGLTTSQLKANTSLAGFDFTNTWAVKTGGEISYPFLLNNTQSPAPGLATADVSPTVSSIETGDAGEAAGSALGFTSDDYDATANNGQIDQLVITFDEPIDDSTVSESDLSLSVGTLDAIKTGDTANDSTLVFEIEESGTADTDATPGLSYTPGTLADPAGNTVSSFSQSASDGAAPAITDATYKDRDGDGQVDGIDVTYSEDISASTLESEDWALSGNDAGSLDIGASRIKEDTVLLAVTGTPTGDTNVDLQVEYTDSNTAGSITDGTNLASGSGTVQATDSNLYAGGSGTALNPYEIANWYNLDNVRENPGANFELVSDLDENTAGYDSVASPSANGNKGFDPIGEDGAEFTGTFDGNGSTIANLTIDRTGEDNVGLFGWVGATGVITNTSLEAAAVTGSSWVGPVAGTNYGTVIEIYATGAVEGSQDVGGVVGWNDGTVEDSYATSTVTGPDTDKDSGTGGLVGENHDNGKITHSYTAGNVSADGGDVGGLVGINSGSANDVYWDVNTTGQDTSAGGTGLTTSQLKANTTLAGFDFTNTWGVVDNSTHISYPYLVNNTQSPAPGLATTESGSGALYAGGSGSENDPYQIKNWTHLNNTRENLDANFTLVADLNESTDDYDSVANASANGDKGFTPIGDYSTPFNGTFDGSGHTIAKLTINRSSETYVGLFSAVGSSSSVWNTTLENVEVNGGQHNVGGVAGLTIGSISNVTVTGTVNGTNIVGGVTGDLHGSIAESTSTADVTGGSGVGGFVGGDLVDGESFTVIDSTASGNVSGTAMVGGLVGIQKGGTLERSTATGSVEGEQQVGGLAGSTGPVDIEHATATGDVIGNQNVGGLVGAYGWKLSVFLGGTIENSTASGNVTVHESATAPTQFGGLVGQNYKGTVTTSNAIGDVQAGDATSVGGLAGTVINATVNQTYATGTVSGDTDVGGLVGNATGSNTEVSQSYAVGSVSATGTPVGGLVGTTQDSATVTDAYWDTETTGVSGSDGGTGLPTSQMIGSDALGSGNMEAFESPPWQNVSDGSPSAADADGYPILEALAAEPQIHTPSVESGTENLYAGGSGIESDPYEIANWTHLNNTRENLGANFTLVADLNKSTDGYGDVHDGQNGFVPIGTESTPFIGTFDGNTSTIADLRINRSSADFVGLFGNVSDGTVITNTTLENATVSGDTGVGGLAGWSRNATVSNSSVKGDVSGSRGVGGLVGVMHNGTIETSSASGTVSPTDSASRTLGIGGLVGANGAVDASNLEYGPFPGGTIVDSNASTTVTVPSGKIGLAAGGLTGFNYRGDIQTSNASGDVWTEPTKPENAGTGGLVGINAGNVTASRATGEVTGRWFVGGLVGGDAGRVSDSIATGNVNGVVMSGGLVGLGVDDSVDWNKVLDSTMPANQPDAGPVRNSKATGDVTSPGSSSGQPDGVGLGGLVGGNGMYMPPNFDWPGVTIMNSTASGNVTVADGSDPRKWIGGLVGQNYLGSITTSNATGDVLVSDATSVGGLVGQTNATGTSDFINESYATGTVNGSSKVGGLVGTSFETSIDATDATGNVTGSSNVGGLVGANGLKSLGPGGTIENATASGTVTLAGDSTDRENLGGLVGQSFQGTVTQSNATGNVNGGDATNVGGLVGYNNVNRPSTIRETYATGAVDGGQNVGGLVGKNVDDLVTDSYAIGSVDGSVSVGGLVGNNTGTLATVNNSYAAGLVTGDSAGGLVGTNESGATVENAYWDTETTVQSGSAAGKGLTTSEMKGDAAQSNMFDFTNTWAVVDNSTHISYPYLLNNTQSPAPGLASTESGTENLYAGGTGTESDPYEIANWTHLNNTRQNLGANFELVDDLNKSTDGYSDVHEAQKGFAPIGNSSTPFTGAFDGNGYTIADLTINRSSENRVGLFGDTGSSAVIANASLEDSDVTGFQYVGGLVGYSSGTVDSSYATGNVSATGNTVGGLVGYSSGTVDSSYATGNVSATDNMVGGLIGTNSGTVDSSYATGTVTGQDRVGGLIGANFATVTDAYWDVNTTGQSDTNDGYDDAGTGLTTTQLKANTSLDGFDFTNTWGVVSGGEVSYPYLLNNTQSPAPGLESLFAGGDGTEANPYQIADWNDLDNVRNALDANFTLVDDLNESTDGYDSVASPSANGDKGFAPIGHSGTRFSGTFDGNGSTIADLTINRSAESMVGLFGNTDGAVIVNVSLENVEVTGDRNVGSLVGYNAKGVVKASSAAGTVHGSDNVGGLVGNNLARVSNSTALVSTTGSSVVGGLVGRNTGYSTSQGVVNTSHATGAVDGSSYVGGLVGRNYVIQGVPTVKTSSATGSVNGSSYVGGLIGGNSGETKTSNASGTVSGSESVGGLVGANGVESEGTSGGSIEASNASGEVAHNANVRAGDKMGGLVGQLYGGSVTRSNATGDISGGFQSQGKNIGGLVGYADGTTSTATITDSYAAGDALGDKRVGGLVGTAIQTEINRTYATGGATGTQSNIGGLVGNATGTNTRVSNSYAVGSVTGNSPVGGLIGTSENGASVIDAYWDVNTTRKDTSDDGTALTTSQLKGNTSLDGFDFGTTWAVKTGGEKSYPYLLNNTQSPAPGLERLFAGGSGTDDDPYELSSPDSLKRVSSAPTASYELTADLDMVGVNHDPIGTASTPFTGTFDGNGYTIENLAIDRPEADDVGLFGSVGASGTVTNVTLTDVAVTGNVSVGGVAGDSVGTVRNASVTGSVSGNQNVGGSVGDNDGTVARSTSTATVSATETIVGGLVGSNDDTVTESYATGRVEGGTNAGGLVGYASGGSTVSESYSMGAVTGSYNVGGLVGQNDGEVTSAYAAGPVTGTDYTGGLVGVDETGASVTDAYWDLNTTGQEASVGGTGLTTGQLKGNTSLAGIDFTNTWHVETGGNVSYPSLQNATQQPAPGKESVRFVARATSSSYRTALGSAVEFSAKTSTVPLGITNPTYDWEIEGTDKSGQTIQHTFDSPGRKTITLTVSGANTADQRTDTIDVTVRDTAAPATSLTHDGPVDNGSAVTFDASGTSDVDSIASYEWRFGDGTTANGSSLTNPSHTYDAPGEYTVSVTATDPSGNAETNTTTVLVRGPTANASATSQAFGDTPTNDTSVSTLTITNDGTTPLNIDAVSITGDDPEAFGVLGSPTGAVAPGQSVTVATEYMPTSTTDARATLEVTTNATDYSLELTGTGVTSDISAGSDDLTFGDVSQGDRETMTVDLENTGGQGADISTEITGSDSGQFTVDSAPTRLDAGATDSVIVAFAPTRPGTQSATLTVKNGSTATVATVPLNGTATGPDLKVGTETVDFGEVGKAKTQTETVSLANYGSESLDVSNVSVDGSDAFTVTDAPASIGDGQRDTVDIQFEPSAAETYTATLSVESNDADSPETIQLNGTGVGAQVSISSQTANFEGVAVSETGYQEIEVENLAKSKTDLSVDRTVITGQDPGSFAVANGSAPFTLSPGETRTLNVSYNPTTTEESNAQLQILSDAGNERQINVWLSSTNTYIIVQEIDDSTDSENATVSVDANNVDTERPLSINVSEPGSRQHAVGFDRLNMSVDSGGPQNFQMNVTHAGNVTPDDYSTDEGETVVEYVELRHADSIPNPQLGDTAIQFRVDTSQLPGGVDTAPDEITFRRYNASSGWTSHDARLLNPGTTGSEYIYAVETPGFSRFVVSAPTATSPGPGSPQPSYPSSDDDDDTIMSEPTADVSGMELSTATATLGKPLRITGVVENTDYRSGTITVPLTVDGTTVATQSVELSSGETTSVTFEHTFDSAGTHEVAIGSAPAQPIDVSPAIDETTTTIQPSTPTTTDQSSTAATTPPERATTTPVAPPSTGGGLPYGILLFGGLAVVIVFFRYRQSDR